MKRLLIYCILSLLIVNKPFAQKEYNKILLEHATIHIGNGEVIPTGLVGIENGKITLIKNSLAYTVDRSLWDTVLNLSGQHVYPGFVAPNSTLGLTEIEAVRASNDFDEVGQINPHVRSQIAYNCESKVLETVKTNGVLIVQSTPRGGLISGSSSVMSASCWNWEDGTILADDGIHIQWPHAYSLDKKTGIRAANPKYDETILKLKSFLVAAKTTLYNKEKITPIHYAAVTPCFNGTKRMYFHAETAQQINDILDFVSELEIAFPVIVGGYESYLVAQRLKLKNIPVMLGRLHQLPMHEDDPVDLPYKLPFLLEQAGVKFCLQNEGDMEAMQARNIPFLAGTAYSYGLNEETAIRSVTLSACEIMGIEKNYGSIEIGKSATLFCSNGSALDMASNQITTILIRGVFVPVNTFQTTLYEKYKKKYKK